MTGTANPLRRKRQRIWSERQRDWQPPQYIPHTTLTTRELRQLVVWQSGEALELAKSYGLELP